MNIGLIDVDSHNFPNLALMKISAWHKARGDEVDWCNALTHYDRVYMSKVFDDTYSPDMPFFVDADEVIRGGTGYGLGNKLSDEIEHMYPDYSLYPEYTKDKAYGFLTRGCPWNCGFCLVTQKEGFTSVKVADLSEWWSGQKNIVLLDPNTLACKDHIDLLRQLAESKAKVDFTQGVDAKFLNKENIAALNQVNTKIIHFAWDLMEHTDLVIRGLTLYDKIGNIHDPRYRKAYVLTNFNTTTEENLYRIYRLREMNYDPYVMIYDKGKFVDMQKYRLLPMSQLLKEFTNEQINHFVTCWRLQRWCNNKKIFRSCERFEDYGKEVPERG